MTQGPSIADEPEIDVTDLIGAGEAAALIGVSGRTLWRWEREGHIRAFVTPSGQRRYVPSEVKALLRRSGAA